MNTSEIIFGDIFARHLLNFTQQLCGHSKYLQNQNDELHLSMENLTSKHHWISNAFENKLAQTLNQAQPNFIWKLYCVGTLVGAFQDIFFFWNVGLCRLPSNLNWWNCRNTKGRVGHKS